MPDWLYIIFIYLSGYTLIHLFIWKDSNRSKKKLSTKGIIGVSLFITAMIFIPISIIGIVYVTAIKGTNFVFGGQFSGSWDSTLALGLHLAITFLILSLFNKPVQNIINLMLQEKWRAYLATPIRILLTTGIIYWTFSIFPYTEPRSLLYCFFLAGVLAIIDIAGTNWLQKQENKQRKNSRRIS
ncbi:hypothetical protein ACFFJY_03015 [Fictibacillus aquaticus]|uniref:Uncharacterized protein n=1 Tax=Fictibacillus aquaticus TaxID=2021314 RepID=A0A235F923_9BACL|nr:hypothetical protein [Fictibacillus aquaticus]OYD57669.1 hypothetical protein CGZ90_13470 [Fictibacillus aquaticus]